MEQKEKALNSALGSTQMEGITLHPEIVDMLQKALKEDKRDKSFLYQLTKLMEDKEKDAGRTK